MILVFDTFIHRVPMDSMAILILELETVLFHPILDG